MPQRAGTIESLPAAFEVVKAMQTQGLDWGEGYRPLGRLALAEIIETEMAAAVDRWLERGVSGILCAGPGFHQVLTKRSSNMMANWVFASAHSRGGIFHSLAT